MKYIKTYENEPQVGDYVVCEINMPHLPELMNFLSGNIGKLVGIKANFEMTKEYFVKFMYIPMPIREVLNTIDLVKLDEYEIIYYSSKKKDCESFIIKNKFNL